MKMFFAVLAAALSATPALADGALSPFESWQAEPTQVFVASDVTLDDFAWRARPIVVFADTENDPRFQEQMALLAERAEELAERDVVVITDTDRSELSPLREKLRPRGFMLVLIGKDGGVKLRKPFPWNVRELSRSIDKMPMRQREIRERRASNLNNQ